MIIRKAVSKIIPGKPRFPKNRLTRLIREYPMQKNPVRKPSFIFPAKYFGIRNSEKIPSKAKNKAP